SVQQKLSPPAEFAEQNFYGHGMHMDRTNIRQLAVACSGCNVSHTDSGAIFIYEATRPEALQWTQGAVLTPSSELKLLGQSTVSTTANSVGVRMDRDKLVAAANTRQDLPVGVVFSKENGKWSQQQTLAMGSTVATDYVHAIDIYDETIVLGAHKRVNKDIYTSTTVSIGAVGIFYPSTDKFGLRPKGKPQPVQWSLQQLLLPPTSVSSSDPEFGYSVSMDQNRLAVSPRINTFKNVYLYERKHVGGKWSLQQSIGIHSEVDRIDFYGSTLLLDVNGIVNIVDETADWDCLVVSLEDHFNDGWDTAKLHVDVPGGDKDSFANRCDTPNPFQFRYCPADKADTGLYKFSITDGVKAKFHWELIWRVYEESTGTWYTGNWDTKMDFEWNSENAQFTHKKIEHDLPNNITCKVCKSKPTEKPSSRLRQLKSKDSTQSPTVSPAPTVLTSVTIQPWQQLTLKAATGDWFDAQHRGTSYYISTVDGKRLLSTGTMCPWETTITKTCWEDYPDGDYILRVGGALDRVATHDFTYCNSVNDLTQESQILFRVAGGDCSIVSHVKSSYFCKNTVGVVQLSILEISLVGVGDAALTATEYASVSSAVANVLPGVSASDVKVTSAVYDGASWSVTVEVMANSQRTGYDFTDAEAVEAWEAATLSKVQSEAGGQAILTSLFAEERATALHSATAVSVNRFYLSGSSVDIPLDGPDMITDFVDHSYVETPTEKSPTSFASGGVMWSAVAGYILAVVGAVALAVIVIGRTAAAPKVEPVHDEELSTAAVEMPSPVSPKMTLADMKELVADQDAALRTMLQNHQI
ncbi:unnamed protein product, partial [Symbiodinium microadriaticum]